MVSGTRKEMLCYKESVRYGRKQYGEDYICRNTYRRLHRAGANGSRLQSRLISYVGWLGIIFAMGVGMLSLIVIKRQFGKWVFMAVSRWIIIVKKKLGQQYLAHFNLVQRNCVGVINVLRCLSWLETSSLIQRSSIDVRMVMILGDIAHRKAEVLAVEKQSESLRFVFEIASIGIMLLLPGQRPLLSNSTQFSSLQRVVMMVAGRLGAYAF